MEKHIQEFYAIRANAEKILRDNQSSYNSFEYDGKITTTLPYYEEFHRQVIDVIRVMNFNKVKWLDTGCGTGKTARKALEELGEMDIDFTLCDISNEMLNIAREILGNNGITYRNIPSQELDYSEEFDVVTAIQCHHYLSRTERKTAVEKCYHALKENGIFITFENIQLENDKADAIAVKRWENYMLSNGKTEQEILEHTGRRGKMVFPLTVAEHLELLKNSGFQCAEILWFSYMQAGFLAIK